MNSYKMLEKNTFGAGECAEVLVKILNNYKNKSYVGSVSHFLQSGNIVVKSLETVPNLRSRLTLIRAYRKDLKHEIDKVFLPEDVKSRVMNLLLTKLTILDRISNIESKLNSMNYRIESITE